jgi:osmotically-inducible protein OsmY
MSNSRWLMSAIVVGGLAAGSACAQQATEGDVALGATQERVDASVDSSREAATKMADSGKNVAQKTVDKTEEIVATVGHKTSEVVSTTGEVITDGWITTAVSTGFVGEASLKGSDINVDTKDHVVTLKASWVSRGEKRAAEIARGAGVRHAGRQPARREVDGTTLTSRLDAG